MKKLMLAIFGMLILTSFVSASELVQFNGNWNNGTTLYSGWYGITSFQGKDVYPIPAACTTKQVCSSYAYHWESICSVYYPNGKCKQHKLLRIDDGCRRYSTWTSCSYSVSPICYNADGSRTNQLDLSNFFYTTDGNSWKKVPYVKVNVNATVQFKVVIPTICRPAYDINKAITISDPSFTRTGGAN